MNHLAQFVYRVGAGLRSRWRNLVLRALGVRMHGYIWLRKVEVPRCWDQIELFGPCSLDTGVTLLASGAPQLTPKIRIAAGTYINRYTMIDAHQQVTIGERCMIGPYCYITDADHGMGLDCPIPEQAMNAQPVIIENDAWLGAHVTVLKGVTIGAGAIVGAGAVVTKNVAPRDIVVGVPARPMGVRGSVEAVE